VAISTKSIAILSSGEEPAAELTKQGDKYPYAELTQTLRAYKTQYTVADNIVLTADATVPYSVLVAAMDAARQDSGGPLFPGVTLGLAVGR
jgi:biopolymer transport protein ExbD